MVTAELSLGPSIAELPPRDRIRRLKGMFECPEKEPQVPPLRLRSGRDDNSVVPARTSVKKSTTRVSRSRKEADLYGRGIPGMIVHDKRLGQSYASGPGN